MVQVSISTVSNSRYYFCMNGLCSVQYSKYERQRAGHEYVRKVKRNRQYSCFLNELQKPAAASIQQTETETESNGVKLVAACMKEGMWLEARDLASLLPLKAVANLEYRMHLRRQRILTSLEA
jgi:hypothetical protein